LLESFSEKELKDLSRIATYPYFNTDRYVVKLLEVLKNKVLGKNWSNTAMQNKIYDKVFFDLPAVSNELNKKQKALLNSKISSLTRLAERFLRMEALENSKTSRCELLMESLLEKRQYRLFNKHYVKEKKQLSKELKTLDYYDFNFSFEQLKLKYFHYNGQLRKNDNLNKLNTSLDIYFLIKKLDITITALSLKEINPENDYDTSVLNLVNTNNFKYYINNNNPFIEIQTAVLNLQINKSRLAFNNLLQLLDKYANDIPNEDLNGFYTIVSTFCIHQTKTGKTEYSQIYTDLHKILDKKNLIVFNNLISIAKIRNIVMCACKAGEFNWVNDMIEKYITFVDKTHRKNIYKFNLGYVRFEQKKFQNAIDLLSEVNNFQKIYDINKRVLILKSYYELEQNYSEPTAQLFRSLEIFIKNHKSLSHKDKITYKTFIRIFYNLYRIKHRVGTIKLDKLKDRIENAEFIRLRSWRNANSNKKHRPQTKFRGGS